MNEDYLADSVALMTGKCLKYSGSAHGAPILFCVLSSDLIINTHIATVLFTWHCRTNARTDFPGASMMRLVEKARMIIISTSVWQHVISFPQICE